VRLQTPRTRTRTCSRLCRLPQLALALRVAQGGALPLRDLGRVVAPVLCQHARELQRRRGAPDALDDAGGGRGTALRTCSRASGMGRAALTTSAAAEAVSVGCARAWGGGGGCGVRARPPPPPAPIVKRTCLSAGHQRVGVHGEEGRLAQAQHGDGHAEHGLPALGQEQVHAARDDVEGEGVAAAGAGCWGGLVRRLSPYPGPLT